MSILINYKNSSYKRNSSSLVLFVDEKFNISPIRKHLSTHENSFVSDLIKAKDVKKSSPKYKTFDGEDFIRSVVWEFPSYEKAIECHNSKEYLAGWAIAKDTTIRHMQVIEGFSTE